MKSGPALFLQIVVVFIGIGFVAGGAIIILVSGDGEDRPAGIFMSLLVAFPAGVVATAAGMLERNLQRALKRSAGDRA